MGQMTPPPSAAARRASLLASLFPGGVPLLWCPPLTHYDRHGAIDGLRIAAHLRHLSAHVKGLLIPGSTGDGWELSEQEIRQLLDIALEQVRRLNLHLLIGALSPDADEALKTIHKAVERLKARARETDPARALAGARVCGFTVCAPRGRQLSQTEIGRALTRILETGLPIALYQLPQVTQNEVSPELASDLALRFENFILFKDTSGGDRVVLSGKDLAGVFTTRGAEGDYARWFRAAGGPYDGFLLGSANCFAAQLQQVLQDISAKRLEAAQQLSDRLTRAVNEVSRLVVGLTQGNAFANANKAMDHFFAYGPRAATAPPPRLHAGGSLPAEVLRATGEILSRHELMPARGYLE